MPRNGVGLAMVLVQEHLGPNRDACNTLDAHRCGWGDKREEANHGYHPRRGRCYDSDKDWSPSPDLPGPQALGQHILNVAFPPRYRPPTNVPKYSGEINPGLWLEDY